MNASGSRTPIGDAALAYVQASRSAGSGPVVPPSCSTAALAPDLSKVIRDLVAQAVTTWGPARCPQGPRSQRWTPARSQVGLP